MLSPSKQDPNCKKEEARKKDNPADFGNYSGNKQPKDFKSVGLKKASTDDNTDVGKTEDKEAPKVKESKK